MPVGPLLLLMACVEPPAEEAVGIVATLEANADIGTVATVRVEASTAVEVTIEVSEAGGPTRRFAAAPVDGGGYDALLTGLAADVDYAWRAVATRPDGAAEVSEEGAFRTEPAPAWAPVFATKIATDPWAKGFVGTTVLGVDSAYVVLDAQGRHVWWWRPDSDLMVCNAVLARDGGSVFVLVADAAMKSDRGAIVQVGLDGRILAEVPAPGAHHDFVELADGGLAYLAFDIRPWDGEDTIGDKLVRLDPATGATETVWSTWDDLPPSRPESPDIYSFGRDWTHANGLAVDPASGDWAVSLHNLDTIVRLAPDGALRWRMGGAESDLALTNDEGFGYQHSPSFVDGEVLLFDNGRGSADPSRAVAYVVEPKTGTYARTWEYVGEADASTVIGGSVVRMPDGGTLVGWGSAGRIERVDADGEVTWRVDTVSGGAPGFSGTVPTLGELDE